MVLALLASICRNNVARPGMVRMISTSPILNKKNVILTASSVGRKIDIELMESQIGIPKKPKKPGSIWVLYLKDMKEEACKANPGVRFTNLTAELGKKWPSVDKTKYREEYAKNQATFLKKLEEYEFSLKADHIPFLELKQKMKTEHKALAELKRTNPLPKQVRNWANFFLISMSKNSIIMAKRLETGKHLNVLMKEMFADLSQEERDHYYKLYEEDRERFKREINEWYKKVCRDPRTKKAVLEQAHLLFERFKNLGYL